MLSLLRVLIFLPVLLSISGCRLEKADPHTAFLGDSITHHWPWPTENFGIDGNTTAQMLSRLPAILRGHHYRRVTILGGTNDVLQHVAPKVTIANLSTMATEVSAAGAQPVLCEIPPIFHSYIKSDHTDYRPAVRALDAQIAHLASVHHWNLIDYYDPMRGHTSYLGDGVHPKRRGYAVMEFTYLREK